MKINDIILAAALVQAIRKNEYIQVRTNKYDVTLRGTLRGFVLGNMYFDHHPDTMSLVWVTDMMELQVPFHQLLNHAVEGELLIRIDHAGDWYVSLDEYASGELGLV